MLSKSKVKDTSKATKDFKYKSLPEAKKKVFEEREKLVDQVRKAHNDNDTRVSERKDGDVMTKIKEVRVIRGKYDDVIATVTEWEPVSP